VAAGVASALVVRRRIDRLDMVAALKTRSEEMNRRTMIIGGAAAVTLLALLAWAFAPRPLEVEVAEATTGPFETTVDEDARTRLADRYVVSAPLAGRCSE